MDLTKVNDNLLHAEYVRRFQRQAGEPLRSSADAYRHACSVIGETASGEPIDQEMFMVVYLNGRNAVLVSEIVFTGTLTASAVYPREIVKRVLDHGAAAVILAHNHPSGNTSPSRDDKMITQKIKEALDPIDVSVHDHVIVAGEQYFSFADGGIL